MARLEEAIIFDEGYRTHPYACSVGKTTIGVGWNLTDNGLPDDIIQELLKRSVNQSVMDAVKVCPSFGMLNRVRQEVLVNMAFNLGKSRLSLFKKMLAAIEQGDFPLASEEMLDSKWAKQVGKRATRLALEMRTGEYQQLT
jgi:lysozyme